jgi:hypothetical protein
LDNNAQKSASIEAKSECYVLGGVVCVGGCVVFVDGGTSGFAGGRFLVFLNHLKHMLALLIVMYQD